MSDMTETGTNEAGGRKISQWNLILIGLLILQSLVIGWTYYWESDGGTVEVGPLFGELTTDDVDSLTIAGIDDDEALQLTRVDDGWAVASRDDFPANGEKIDGVVEKLLAMDSNRLVTKTSASHKRLQVAEDTFASRVMVTADGDEQTLYVGSAPSAGATHIRLAGENETYLTGEIASWELGTQLSSWIDTSYLDVEQDNVTSFTLQNENGDFAFIREGDGWTLRGLLEGTIKASEVNSLLGRAANLRMAEPLGKTAQDAYGMDAPLATVVLNLDDGEGNAEEVVLTVGSKNAEGDNYVMKASTSDYYVNVSGFTGDGFVEKVQDDFLEEVEEVEEAVPSEGEGN